MPDMLVKLYDLPDASARERALKDAGIAIKRVMTPDYGKVFRFIQANFSEGWAYEACSAIARVPGGLFAAVRERDGGGRGGEILGFAAYDATARGFFGPTGVLETERHAGIGTVLLLRCLRAMREDGYVYAIIGSAGPVDYYRKVCGATVIEGSSPGIYSDLI